MKQARRVLTASAVVRVAKAAARTHQNVIFLTLRLIRTA